MIFEFGQEFRKWWMGPQFVALLGNALISPLDFGGTRPWQVLLRQGMLFWEIPWEIPCFHGGFNGNMSFCMVLGFCSQCDV